MLVNRRRNVRDSYRMDGFSEIRGEREVNAADGGRSVKGRFLYRLRKFSKMLLPCGCSSSKSSG